jgi:L-threonylcarbamoyladenylate synthase
VTIYLSPDELDRAAGILKAGGVVAFPTETVFGLGATVENSAKIFKAKKRAADKNLVLQFPDIKSAAKYLGGLDKKITALLEKFAGITVVINDNTAIRIPQNQTARAILTRVHPLAVTSANISGEAPATNWADIKPELLDRIAAVVCSNECETKIPSTIVRLVDGKLEIIRSGATNDGALIDFFREMCE